MSASDDAYRARAEKLEFERIEDLITSARKLTDRALERLSIETADRHYAQTLAMHARIILTAATAVLERI